MKSKLKVSSSKPSKNQQKYVSKNKFSISASKNLCVRNKKLSLAATSVLLIVAIFIVPATRYYLLGSFIHKDISFYVKDDMTNEPVQQADILIGTSTYHSDDTGLVSVKKIAAGIKTVQISKPFFEPLRVNFTVTAFKQNKQKSFKMHATGRLVKATVKNRFTNLPIEGITVQATKGGNAKTNKDGIATLVLPSDTTESDGFISGKNIVTSVIKLRAAQDSLTNSYLATPAGKVYFLSKNSGKIDVVKTNLDGTERQVVLAGTGNEDSNETILSASSDWAFVALKSRRDSNQPELFIIDTNTDTQAKVSTVSGTILPIGWVGKHFIYKVDNYNQSVWQAGRTKIMMVQADTLQQTTLDQTRAEGSSYLDYAGEYIGDTYLTNDKLVYTKYWSASYYYGSRLADKRIVVATTSPEKPTPSVVKEWQAGYNAYIRSAQSGPQKFYYYVQLDGVQNSFWQLASGVFTQSTELGPESFNNTTYPKYVMSPAGANTVWAEQRDGKNVMLLGDDTAENSKELARTSDMLPYGWFSDDYILLSKNGSELYIIGRDGIRPGDAPTKITDYHKAAYDFPGYGGY